MASGLIVCDSKTGYAKGSLSPVIFFERSPDNYAILPQYDAGHPEQARHVFDVRYRNHPTEKWAWRETNGTLASVRDLEKRLIDQERRRTEDMRECDHVMREASRRAVRDRLYATMVSSSTTPFERDAIRIWLDRRDEKTRNKIEQELNHHHWYLWSLEQNASTKIEDRMPMQPGEFWRTEAQQKG